MLLTLPEIEDKIREYASIIDAPEELIPTFGFSDQSGLSHIEIQDGCYFLIVCQKGDELSRESFDSTDELVFKVLQDISYSMACDLDFDGADDQNFRERFLDAQQHLMSKIYTYYSENAKRKKATLITEDNTALSASRKKILIKSNIKKGSLPTKSSKALGKKG
ncbi:MAG: hypothetical protein OEW87_10420 [Flavobacteriaceae bacterium]|nr:hypothetical protein [Flavobacteriaceae bacterium]